MSKAASCKQSWLKSIFADLKRLQQSNVFAELSGRPVVDVLRFLVSSPHESKKCLIKALSETSLNSRMSWATARVHREIAGPMHACSFCVKEFASSQAMAVHCFKEHGIRRSVARYVRTGFCECCLQYFETRARVIEHLCKSRRCSSFYLEVQTEVGEAEMQQSCEQYRVDVGKLRAQGYRYHKAKCPAWRLQGPLLKQACDNGVDHKHLLRLRGCRDGDA